MLRLDVPRVVRNRAAPAAGAPTLCGSCGAVLSGFSVITDAVGGGRTWACEFCGCVNAVALEDSQTPAALAAASPPTVAEVPPGQPAPSVMTTHYVVVPAPPAVTTDTPDPAVDASDSTLVFVLDTSGSMDFGESVSAEVAERLNPADDYTAQREMLVAAGLSEAEIREALPPRGHRRGGAYVSRMTSLKAAVTRQLDTLARTHPNRRVAIVTFNSLVKVYTVRPGAGEWAAPQLVKTDIDAAVYNDLEGLFGASEGIHMGLPIGQSCALLKEQVERLSADGRTALGPAVLLGLHLAGQVGSGKLMVVTDGLANVGLGEVEAATGDKAPAMPAPAFYNAVSTLALNKGVVIDVMGFTGASCNLELIGNLAASSNGAVSRVGAATIIAAFGDAAAEEVLGTECNVSVLGHIGLELIDPTADTDVIAPDVTTAPDLRALAAAAAAAAGGGAAAVAPGGAGAGRPAPTHRRFNIGDRNHMVASAYDAGAGYARGGDTPRVCVVASPSPYMMTSNKQRAVRVRSDSEAEATPRPAPAGDGADVDADGVPDEAPAVATTTLPRIFMEVGTVTDATEVTIEYKERPASPAITEALRGLTHLPFQAQIAVRKPDGSIILVVVTARQPIVAPGEGPEPAAGVINAAALLSHASRVCAAQARRGEYAKASRTLAEYDHIAQTRGARDERSQSHYSAWRGDAAVLQSSMAAELAAEGRSAPRSAVNMMRSAGMSAPGTPYPAAGAAYAPLPAPTAPQRAVRGPPVPSGRARGGMAEEAAAPSMMTRMAMAMGMGGGGPMPVPMAAPAAAAAFEDDSEEEDEAATPVASMSSAVSRAARRTQNDDLSSQLYKMRRGFTQKRE